MIEMAFNHHTSEIIFHSEIYYCNSARVKKEQEHKNESKKESINVDQASICLKHEKSFRVLKNTTKQTTVSIFVKE